MVFIDVTGVFLNGIRLPTGILRVETAIVKYLLSSSGDDICFISISKSGKSLELSQRSISYLRQVVGFDNKESRDKPLFSRLRLAFNLLRSGRDFHTNAMDRQLALLILRKNKESGLLFNTTKLFMRICHVISSAFSISTRNTSDPLASCEALAFISFDGMERLRYRVDSGDVGASLSSIVHDLIPIRSPEYSSIHFAERLATNYATMLRKYRTIFCVSEDTKRDLLAWAARRGFPDRSEDLVVLRLGSFFSDGSKGLKPREIENLAGKSLALYCSTIEPRKNHALLVHVWTHLAAELGAGCPTLVLVGRWGWGFEEIEKKLRSSSGIDKYVKVFSNIADDQLLWLYRNARFGVFPSFVEGWGLGATECLDFDLPVIVSTASGLVEAVQGLMPSIDANDGKSWLAAVERAATDDAWLAELRAEIRNRYHPRGASDFVEDLLNAVRDGAGAAVGVAGATAAQ